LRVKAESSLQFSAEELEKIKAAFDTERAAFETQRATLIKRAEDAEGRLAAEAQELVDLKRHITNMTTAIFGKQHLLYSMNPLQNMCRLNIYECSSRRKKRSTRRPSTLGEVEGHIHIAGATIFGKSSCHHGCEGQERAADADKRCA
jgi:hypothetical protein